MTLSEDEIRSLPAGNRLDALVHEALGLSPVVGEAYCWAPDGCWSVEGGDGSNGDTELRPVFQEFFPPDNDPDTFERVHFGSTAGVCNLWLKPVRWYSTNPADA